MQHTSLGAWASIDSDCPVRCTVEGSDLTNLVIGDDHHSIDLIFSAEGLRKLAELSVQAVVEMDALFEREASAPDVVTAAATSEPGGVIA
jgi:hypothetical protein